MPGWPHLEKGRAMILGIDIGTRALALPSSFESKARICVGARLAEGAVWAFVFGHSRCRDWHKFTSEDALLARFLPMSARSAISIDKTQAIDLAKRMMGNVANKGTFDDLFALVFPDKTLGVELAKTVTQLLQYLPHELRTFRNGWAPGIRSSGRMYENNAL